MAQDTIIDSWYGRQRDRKEDMNRRKPIHSRVACVFEAYSLDWGVYCTWNRLKKWWL